MPKFLVSAVWTIAGSCEIEADDEDRARIIAEEDLDLGDFNGEYLSSSFVVDDVEELEESDES